MEKNEKSLLNLLKEIKNGSKVSVTLCTEPKMRKTGNSLFGQVKKYTIHTGITLGSDYGARCNGAISRSGETTESNYEVSSPKGMKFYDKKLFVSEKDEEQFYLNLSFSAKEMKSGIYKNTSYYLVNENIATDDEKNYISQFLPKHYDCKKQVENGISDENIVSTIRPKLQNVVQIKCGSIIWTRI